MTSEPKLPVTMSTVFQCFSGVDDAIHSVEMAPFHQTLVGTAYIREIGPVKPPVLDNRRAAGVLILVVEIDVLWASQRPVGPPILTVLGTGGVLAYCA